MKRTGCGAAWVATGLLLFCIGAQAEDWATDFKKASSEAKAGKKHMLLDFSGSDWCGWCMKLEKEVFSTKEFKEYAATNLVCVLLDFPRKKAQSNELKKQNAELAKKYKVEGYPTVIILAPDGELVAATGYQEGGAKKYVEYLKKTIQKGK